MGADPRSWRERARELHEFNPMLGFRGCRLGIAYPEIAEMQARAIFEAAVEARRDRQAGGAGGDGAADRHQGRARPRQGAHRAMARRWRRSRRQARLPGRHHDRAAARGADGRRDRRERRVLLVRHQRPDPDHLRHQPRRRGELPRHLCRAASCRPTRSSRSTARASASWCGSASSAAARRAQGLKVGICGEHGGDPASVAFCHEVGLDYVSCSPFRVPIARLAAAQAALGGEGGAARRSRLRAATAVSGSPPPCRGSSRPRRADWRPRCRPSSRRPARSRRMCGSRSRRRHFAEHRGDGLAALATLWRSRRSRRSAARPRRDRRGVAVDLRMRSAIAADRLDRAVSDPAPPGSGRRCPRSPWRSAPPAISPRTRPPRSRGRPRRRAPPRWWR